MINISECEVAAFFVGKKVHFFRLSSIETLCYQGSGNYRDCTEYVINAADYLQGCVSERYSYKERKNITLMILMDLCGDIIKGLRICKYKTIVYPDGYSSGYEIEPDDIDIALVYQILQYIVHEESEETNESDSNWKQIQNL